MDKANVCPIEITVSLISDKWIILIIRELLTGTKRFNELKKSIGSVTQKVLTQSLRKMETNGLIDRKIYNEIPPKVEYSLTKVGLSLKPILDAMKDWGQDYLEKNK